MFRGKRKSASRKDTGADRLECDVILRGGVVSGLVYPGAVAEIATHYRLRSIGGTSAGALAAAAAAAMEFGRWSGRNPDALRDLQAIPRHLARMEGGQTRLARLFEADYRNRPLFDSVIAALKRKRLPIFSPLGRSLLAYLLGLPILWAIVATVIVWAAFGDFIPPANPTARDYLFILIGVALTIAISVIRFFTGAPARWVEKILAPVRENGFGLCSGWRADDAPVGAGSPLRPPASLTGWAHRTIQDLAGLPDDEPLTFGDLWAASRRKAGVAREAAFEEAVEAAKNPGGLTIDTVRRDVDLTLITTDINRRLLIQMPFLNEPLFARISELARFFPPAVVDWMRRHGRRDRAAPYDDDNDLIGLPAPEDLPVVFAARLSAGFPLLFSGVPLYIARGHASSHALVRVWLLDGGLASNFPIHLFDSPIPGRPTLCLNLAYHSEELGDETATAAAASSPFLRQPGPGDRSGKDRFLYMPNSKEGQIRLLSRLSTDGKAAAGIARLLLLTFDAARLWNDNMAMDVPGYRDRIMHIWMDQQDSAFNFRLAPDRIRRMDEKGRKAGEMLARRFFPEQRKDPLRPRQKLELNWTNHRLVRLRSFLAALEISAGQFGSVWSPGRGARHRRFEPVRLLAEWVGRVFGCAKPAKAARPGDRQAIPSYQDILGKAGKKRRFPKVGYAPRDPAQRALLWNMARAVEALAGLSAGRKAQADYVDGEPTSPRPKPILRTRPPLDSDPFAERPRLS